MTNFFYRVQEGDTVLSISNRFNIPACKIIRENSLKKEVANGDLLYLSQPEKNCKTYRVRPLETIGQISKKFNIPEQEILQTNGVDYIFYGQIIVL